jgi:ubiquinone/menaquinone biosynthesis C-methylase UbiE
MNKIDLIKGFYEPLLKENSEDFERLGWENEKAQNLRFQVLYDHTELKGKSLLDVGCGLGNLLGYLMEKGVNLRYTGVDILDNMVKEAKGRYPDAEFIHGDIFTDELFKPGSFDCVFSSGIFNLNLGNNIEFFPIALEKMFSLSRETVVINLLHKHSGDIDELYFYYHPDEVQNIIRSLIKTPVDIKIVEEYLPNDFTVICTKG